MKKAGVVAFVTGLAIASGAMAQQPPDPAADGPTPWAGGYAGILGNYFEPGDRRIGGVGGVLGYSFAAGGIVISLEVEAYELFFDPASLNVLGRALIGLPLGESALAYGVVALGGYFWPHGDSRYAQVGAGLDVAIGRSASVRGEVLGIRYPDRTWTSQLDFGLVWRFGQ